MDQKGYDKIIQTCWDLAKEGIDALDNEKIAHQSGTYEIEINALFPEKKNIILALLADLKTKAPFPPYNPDLNPDDQFFDAIMILYDAATPHKEAIKRLSQDLVWNPMLAISLTGTFQHFANEIIKQFYPIPSEGSPIKGYGQQLAQNLGYQVLLLRVFYVWLEDETSDLSKTMAALDQGIKQIAECRSWFNFDSRSK